MMLKRIAGGLATMGLVVAGLAAGAAPASATTSTTDHSQVINSAVPGTCDSEAGFTTFVGTGNTVQHLTVNNAGDGWFTTTTEGTVTLTTVWHGSLGTWIGHLQEWFGSADNNQNGVQHATFNFQGVSTSNSANTIDIHAAFTTTTNANGVVTVNNLTISCR